MDADLSHQIEWTERERLGAQHDSDYFWHTDIYELRDQRWQAVWSHATRIR